MFPGVYRQATDTVYGQLAASLDGVNWSRLTRQAIIPNGAPGESDAGYVYPEPSLIRFSQHGKFRVLCRSGGRFHNQWYNEALRSEKTSQFYQWAEWPEDRLAGMHADADGALTILMQTGGDRLLANFRTDPGGWLRFELVDRLVWPPQPTPGLEGFRFDDMLPLTGDQTHAPVAWNGSRDLAAVCGKPVAIRVRLYKATLFSVTMYGVNEALVQHDPRYPI